MMNSKDRANNDIASTAAGGIENDCGGIRVKNRTGGVLGKTTAVGFSIDSSGAKHDGARSNTVSSSSEDDPSTPAMKKKMKTVGDEQQEQQKSPSSDNRRGRRLSRPRRHRKVSAAPMKPMRRRVHEIKA